MRPARHRAWMRLALFVLLNIVLVPVYLLAGRRQRVRIQLFYCRQINRMLGLRVRTVGEACSERPVLFVANHVSYLDIPVLGSLIDAVFVAKAEVARWPLFGLLARLTRTAFVERAGGEVMAQRQDLSSRLGDGDSLILFPEGTSTDGAAVRPFKSSLFSIAAPAGGNGMVTVQPVSIAYARYADGTPLIGAHRALYCWFGGATLMPHMLRVFGLKGALVEVRFHPPLRAGDWGDRKDLARRAHALVAAGVDAAQSGDAAPTHEAALGASAHAATLGAPAPTDESPACAESAAQSTRCSATPASGREAHEAVGARGAARGAIIQDEA